VSRKRDWYDEAETAWHGFKGGIFDDLTPQEVEEDYPDFLDMLAGVEYGFRPTETLGWESLKQKYGLDDDDFDWDDFKEWYDSV